MKIVSGERQQTAAVARHRVDGLVREAPESGVSTQDAAAAAARRGWAVFPCRPGDKRPAVDRWEQRAIADPGRVLAHWPGGRHNVGIACGPSRLVVLDLDAVGHGPLPPQWAELDGIRSGRDVLRQLAEWAGQPWPATFTVATPNGGEHLYYTAPAEPAVRNSAGRLGPLVDVRGQGGYVVGPGSVVHGRAYRVVDDRDLVPLPAWLARLAARAETTTARDSSTPAAAPGARIRGLVEHVAAGTAGDRNGRLYWAACRAGELIAAGQASTEMIMEQLMSAAAAAGLRGGEAEARRTITSGMRAGGAS